MKFGIAPALLLATITVAAPALAGERTNLGAIPTLPAVKDAASPGKTMGVAGLKLKEQQTARSSYYEISAATAQGYCLVNRNEVFELESETVDTDRDELWHLTEKDGAATLERTRYQVASYLGNAWVKSQTSVALKPLATELGITAWGVRDSNGDVVVIANRATFGRESAPQSANSLSATSSSCTFGATRIRASSLKSGGGSAQLTGRLPAIGEGKSRVEPAFIIDISAVKVSRDPEPVISVRFRKGPD